MPSWKHVDIKTKQGFRGLAAVDATTAWVGGSEGGVWRTTDAGKTWDKVGPELAKPLLFRDIEATDADHAQILSIGPGRQSRIYRTADGGAHLGAHLHQQGPGRVLRLHGDVPRRCPRPRDERPGGRQVPDRRDRGRRQHLVGRLPQGDAQGRRRRVRLRGQRHLPGHRRHEPRLLRLRRRRQPDLLLQGLRQDLEGRQQPDPRRRRGRGLLPGVQGREDRASPSAATSPSPTTARRPRRTAPARTGPPAATSAATAPASPGCRAASPWPSPWGRPAATSRRTAGSPGRRSTTGPSTR